MLPELDPAADHHGLLIELARLAAHTPPEFAARSACAISRWSVGQHLEHVLRADELNLRAIEKIIEGRDDGPEPPLSEPAIEILTTGSIPRGLADAPAVVIPPLDPDLDRIEELRQLQIGRWQGLEADLPRLAKASGQIAHPLLGAFRTVDWLRFARIHTRHHRCIVEEIVGSI